MRKFPFDNATISNGKHREGMLLIKLIIENNAGLLIAFTHKLFDVNNNEGFVLFAATV